jgi:hypothetical protein
MIKTKALSSAAVLGMVAMLFAGCGDGDNTKTQVCRPAEATCLDDSNGGQVCSADGTDLVDFSCEDGETCSNGGCVDECTPGEFTCAGKAVSRVCTDAGDMWEPVVCPAGTACEEGTGCVPSAEGVEICTPNESVCANDTTVKTCDEDGAGFFYSTCPEGVACTDGECSFDAATNCTPRDKACADNVTAATCNDDGSGWTITDCPEGVACTDGVCQGSGCVVGATKCDEPDLLSIVNAVSSLQGAVDFRVMYTCVDGVNWEITQCDAGTICTYDNIPGAEVERFSDELAEWYLLAYGGGGGLMDFPALPDTSNSVASCKAPECDAPAENFVVLTQALRYFGFYGDPATLDFAQCGNATDASVEPTTAFSVCEGLPPYRNLEWSVTECPEPTTCSTELSYGGPFVDVVPTCSSECVPGEVRCTGGSQGGGGSIDSTQTCGADGKWGLAEECPQIAYEGEETYTAVCVPGHAGGETVGTQTARCIDPVCAYWETSTSPFYGLPAEQVGACTQDGLFRLCDDQGFLDDAEACDSGICTNFYGSLDSPAGGQVTGFCGTECVDGESVCFNGNTIRTCEDGEWSLELDVCDADVSCYGYYGDDGLNHAICGECVPGTTTCGAGGTIVTCDDGVLVEDECSYGTCVFYGNFAHCEAPCLEGAKYCSSDGSTGYTECVNGELVAQTCDTGLSCRIDDHGEHYACVECLGTGTSGNSYNLADAYCNVAGDVVTCGADNEYGSPDACDGTCTSALASTDTAPLVSTYAYCGPTQVVDAVQ